jgi:hypothetical protein
VKLAWRWLAQKDGMARMHSDVPPTFYSGKYRRRNETAAARRFVKVQSKRRGRNDYWNLAKIPTIEMMAALIRHVR